MAPIVVHFRWYRTGHPIALFPYEAVTKNPRVCMSYMKVGKHGPAPYNAELLQNTQPADIDNHHVKALIKELESIGYVLDIRKRAPPVNTAYARRYNTIMDEFRRADEKTS